MKITINDHRKIFAVQQEFSKLFPHLRLDFYGKPPKVEGIHSNKPVKHSNSKTLGEIRNVHNKGSITITPNMSAEDLKRNFDDVFGLMAEVMVKRGMKWEPAKQGNGITLALQELHTELLIGVIL